jgi:hypothetical protein
MESEQLQVGVAASTQAAMIEPELVRQIRALEAMRWGSKRIARKLGLALMTVKRYRRGGAEAEAQHRPTRRALDDEQRAKTRELFDTTAEGNAVVVTHLLAEEGIDVDSPPPRAAASAIAGDARWDTHGQAAGQSRSAGTHRALCRRGEADRYGTH